RTVAARVRDVHNPPRRASRHRVEKVCIHGHARLRDRFSSLPGYTPLTPRVGWKMKDPVSRRLVLPLTRLEQVAHNGYGSGITQTLRRLHGLCEAGHLMATGHEDLDQLGANESGGSR